MSSYWSRRTFLAGLAAATPAVAYAGPVIRPAPRQPRRQYAEPLSAIIEREGLGAHTGVSLFDLSTGAQIENHQADQHFVPASVTKMMTALYADTHLGTAHRFRTRLMSDVIPVDGVLHGDLVLAGGGDPMLDTDRLGELADTLKDAGVTKVTGKFLYHDAALPEFRQIAPDQPPQSGYNPAISGLNLNFNRVHFEWKRQSGNYTVTMQARDQRYTPNVSVSRMEIANGLPTTYVYKHENGRDLWKVSRNVLGTGGARWLPVRNPGFYAAEVFARIARRNGLDLTDPIETLSLPMQELSVLESPALPEIQKEMLHYSNNLVAEVLGLQASMKAGAEIAALSTSAVVMNRWLMRSNNVLDVNFRNHSGLSDESRIRPGDMAALIGGQASQAVLAPLLKAHRLANEEGGDLGLPGISVVAKTGTLDFVRALSGYLMLDGTPRYAFAIMAQDLEAREATKDSPQEHPPGSRQFLRKARKQEAALLRRWARVFLQA